MQEHALCGTWVWRNAELKTPLIETSIVQLHNVVHLDMRGGEVDGVDRCSWMTMSHICFTAAINMLDLIQAREGLRMLEGPNWHFGTVVPIPAAAFPDDYLGRRFLHPPK